MKTEIERNILYMLEQEEQNEWGNPNKIRSQMDMHQRANRLSHIQKRKAMVREKIRALSKK